MLRFPYFRRNRKGQLVPNLFMMIYLLVPSLYAMAAWSQGNWSFGKALVFIAIFALSPVIFNVFCYMFEDLTHKRVKSVFMRPE